MLYNKKKENTKLIIQTVGCMHVVYTENVSKESIE